MTTQKVIAYLRFAFYRHGWPAAAGLALAVGAIGLQVLGVAPARAQAVELRAQAAALRLNLAQRPSQDEAASRRLVAFYASLPAAASALEAIAAIHQSADSHGVKLAHGEYRLAREGGTQLLRYQISLPARASYPRLRAWLAEVMNTLPGAALDEVNFRRDDIGADAVEARVRLTLFLRQD